MSSRPLEILVLSSSKTKTLSVDFPVSDKNHHTKQPKTIEQPISIQNCLKENLISTKKQKEVEATDYRCDYFSVACS
jgi:hypothetical protein